MNTPCVSSREGTGDALDDDKDEESIGDWGIRFIAEPRLDNPFWIAELSFRQKVVCRLSHRNPHITAEQHRKLLLNKALDWIAAQQGRIRSGSTTLSELN